MFYPIKVKSNTIELTVRTSCYSVLDLLCVNIFAEEHLKNKILEDAVSCKFQTWWILDSPGEEVKIK